MNLLTRKCTEKTLASTNAVPLILMALRKRPPTSALSVGFRLAKDSKLTGFHTVKFLNNFFKAGSLSYNNVRKSL